MKKCKGSSKAKGFGCNVELPYTERNGIKTYKAKYGLGLDCKCYYKWLSGETPEAKEQFNKLIISNRKRLEDEKKRVNRELKRMVDTKSAMRLADTYFSRYIRLFYADLNGNCTCYTCGDLVNLKECDNGHYQKREHKATRYHLNNCRPQCKSCNGDTKHNGKQDVFRKNLVYEIGEENVLEIEKLARSTFKTNTLWFREIADKYRIKLNELQDKLKVKYW